MFVYIGTANILLSRRTTDWYCVTPSRSVVLAFSAAGIDFRCSWTLLRSMRNACKRGWKQVTSTSNALMTPTYYLGVVWHCTCVAWSNSNSSFENWYCPSGAATLHRQNIPRLWVMRVAIVKEPRLKFASTIQSCKSCVYLCPLIVDGTISFHGSLKWKSTW